MKNVSLNEFRKAMIIVESYYDQIVSIHAKSAKQIGCLVILSQYGKEVDKDNECKNIKRQGKIIDWLDWCSTPTCEDGLVTIKWDGILKPETRHISQVSPI